MCSDLAPSQESASEHDDDDQNDITSKVLNLDDDNANFSFNDDFLDPYHPSDDERISDEEMSMGSSENELNKLFGDSSQIEESSDDDILNEMNILDFPELYYSPTNLSLDESSECGSDSSCDVDLFPYKSCECS